jgi:hypothetical protein
MLAGDSGTEHGGPGSQRTRGVDGTPRAKPRRCARVPGVNDVALVASSVGASTPLSVYSDAGAERDVLCAGACRACADGYCGGYFVLNGTLRGTTADVQRYCTGHDTGYCTHRGTIRTSARL